MMRSDSGRQSSSSETDGAEVVYLKDNVTIHPTQFASERISGRLKLIKQGPCLFMVLLNDVHDCRLGLWYFDGLLCFILFIGCVIVELFGHF